MMKVKNRKIMFIHFKTTMGTFTAHLSNVTNFSLFPPFNTELIKALLTHTHHTMFVFRLGVKITNRLFLMTS